MGLLLTLPKDLARMGDVKENYQKADIKIQVENFFKKQNWTAKSSSVMIQKSNYSFRFQELVIQ